MSEEHKAKTLEMIAVMQAYVDGKPIESQSRGAEHWYSSGTGLPIWDWGDCDYRIATTPDSINWDHVSPEWKYMARDNSGGAWLHKDKPKLTSLQIWEGNYDPIPCFHFSSYVRGNVDWKDSLVKRPD